MSDRQARRRRKEQNRIHRLCGGILCPCDSCKAFRVTQPPPAAQGAMVLSGNEVSEISIDEFEQLELRFLAGMHRAAVVMGRRIR